MAEPFFKKNVFLFSNSRLESRTHHLYDLVTQCKTAPDMRMRSYWLLTCRLSAPILRIAKLREIDDENVKLPCINNFSFKLSYVIDLVK